MSAQPVHPAEPEDPHDPQVILRDLPERERAFFLAQYRAAAAAARDDPAKYKDLRRLLHTYSLVVIATNQPGYYEDLEAAKNGTLETVPIEDVIAERLGISRAEADAYWAGKVEAARQRRNTA